MEYAVVSTAAAALRRKPGHRKEMVNQLLFGETVKVLKEKDEQWVKVRSLHDEYEGWVTNSLLEPVTESFAETRSFFSATGLMNGITVGEKKINIPVGSSLPFFENAAGNSFSGRGKLGDADYFFTGDYVNRAEQKPGPELLQQLTFPWLNAPYLWGGRTPLGVDCSGFVQVIYKLMGIDLPRDAWQQAQEGRPVKKITEAQSGDLAFFDHKEEIVHVGILLGGETMIHASGKVRIDKVIKKGIVYTQPVKRVLKLRAIRRIW